MENGSLKTLLLLGLLSGTVSAAEPVQGYQAKVAVTAPTRLDWTFALSNRSLDKAPDDWLPRDYDSTKQSYELFVPPRPDKKKALPVVMFISPSDAPAGWKQFEKPCKQLGMIFVGVRGAGNDCPVKKRIRIVLDVLDDVRRTYPTDPDRTYLAGFSGGGRMACAIGFALPEYFGGVMPICAGGELRKETWLRHRLTDRLSIAVVTGEKDFNRGEVERLRGPYWKEIGVRTRIWTQPGLGHGIPSETVVLEALRWLEEGAAARRELAKKYPASRAADTAPSRAASAKALLAEGRERLRAKATLYSGLMQVQGVMERWEGSPEADEAKKILLEYDAKKDRPWEADDIAEQRRFLIAQARALTAYASGDLPPQYAKTRPDMAKGAIELWKQILVDGPDTEAGREAKKRISELEKLTGEK
jgi:hypothetical protein